MSDPSETVEALADSGQTRLKDLDPMLSGAAQSEIKGGELGRGGSQKGCISYQARAVTDRPPGCTVATPASQDDECMTMVYTISDL